MNGAVPRAMKCSSGLLEPPWIDSLIVRFCNLPAGGPEVTSAFVAMNDKISWYGTSGREDKEDTHDTASSSDGGVTMRSEPVGAC